MKNFIKQIRQNVAWTDLKTGLLFLATCATISVFLYVIVKGLILLF